MSRLRELVDSLTSLQASGLPPARVFAWLQAILGAAEEPLVAVDSEGRVQLCNPPAAGLFRLPVIEARAKHLDYLIPDLFEAIANRSADNPGVSRPEDWEERRALPFPAGASDVGELKVAVLALAFALGRERYWLLQLRTAPVLSPSPAPPSNNRPEAAVIGRNLEGIVMSWNPGAEQLLGYRAEEIIGLPMVLLIPADRQCEEVFILERLRRGRSFRERYESVRKAKGGQRIPVSLTLARSPTGKSVTETVERLDVPARFSRFRPE